MLMFSKAGSDNSGDDYTGSQAGFNLVDVKLAMDPDAQNPRRKVRAKDTKGLAELIASQGKAVTNLDKEYRMFMDGSQKRV